MIHFASEGMPPRPGYRYTAEGVGYLETARPRISWGHLDGPLLVMRDGTLHWLTLWERFCCWLGLIGPLDIEHKHRPELSSIEDLNFLPCMFCGENIPPGSEVSDDYGNYACEECGTSEIAAQQAEGRWPR